MPVEELIGHKIHAPTLMGTHEFDPVQAMSPGPVPAGPFAAQIQPLKLVKTIYALVIDTPAFPAQ